MKEDVMQPMSRRTLWGGLAAGLTAATLTPRHAEAQSGIVSFSRDPTTGASVIAAAGTETNIGLQFEPRGLGSEQPWGGFDAVYIPYTTTTLPDGTAGRAFEVYSIHNSPSTGARQVAITAYAESIASTGVSNGLYGVAGGVIASGAGSIHSAQSFYAESYVNHPAAHVGTLYGTYFDLYAAAGTVDSMQATYTLLGNFTTTTVSTAYGHYVAPFVNSGGGAITTGVALWVGEQTAAANNYFLWYDSPGVYRIKGDGIMAYYNPTFTKYTPGATAFERVVQQWAANVLQYGTEKGTTGGSARPLAFITDGVERLRILADKPVLVLDEADANPGTSNLDARDSVAIYTKANKFVLAYNIGGTMNYLTIQLDGFTTTWTNSTSAP